MTSLWEYIATSIIFQAQWLFATNWMSHIHTDMHTHTHTHTHNLKRGLKKPAMCKSRRSRSDLRLTCTVGVTKNCAAETILSESGISYSWPTIFGGETATLTCPLNSNVIVTRNCSNEGSWQNIIDSGCTVNEQLQTINTSFTNVRNINMKKAYNIIMT